MNDANESICRAIFIKKSGTYTSVSWVARLSDDNLTPGQFRSGYYTFEIDGSSALLKNESKVY